MPRTISRPSQTYQPGTYGPFNVDQLSNANTDALEWSATIEGWPSDPTVLLFKATLAWDTGGGATWHIYGGRKNRDGTPATEVRERIFTPVESNGAGGVRKGQIGGGSFTVEVFQPVTTAFTIAGV